MTTAFTGATPPGNPGSAEPTAALIVKFVVAAVVLIAYGAAAWYLASHSTDPEPQWSRLADVFGGLEAIALAAAGFVFGTEVNRKRAENAEKKAEVEEAQRTDAADKLGRLKGIIQGASVARRALAPAQLSPAWDELEKLVQGL